MTGIKEVVSWALSVYGECIELCNEGALMEAIEVYYR